MVDSYGKDKRPRQGVEEDSISGSNSFWINEKMEWKPKTVLLCVPFIWTYFLRQKCFDSFSSSDVVGWLPKTKIY